MSGVWSKAAAPRSRQDFTPSWIVRDPVEPLMAVASVPTAAMLIPDLPEWCAGAKVFMDDGWHERHRAGLPRAVSDVLGRVNSARWESDATIELDISWTRGYGWGELVDEGKITLSLAVLPATRRVEVVANAVIR